MKVALLRMILLMTGAVVEAQEGLNTCEYGDVIGSSLGDFHCGDKCVSSLLTKACLCGSGNNEVELSSYQESQYCCIQATDQCEWTSSARRRASCPRGQVINKTDPCLRKLRNGHTDGKCYNNYVDNLYIASDGRYTCAGGQTCVRVQNMCFGVNWCGSEGADEEAAICGPDLRCIHDNLSESGAGFKVASVNKTEIIRKVYGRYTIWTDSIVNYSLQGALLLQLKFTIPQQWKLRHN